MSDVTPAKPAPEITPENAHFWTSGAHGRLCFLHCAHCDHVVHPPAPICPLCRRAELAPKDVSGQARVATFTINHHQWHPAFPPPYVIAIVEIDDAPYVRLTTRIVDCAPSAVYFGMPVRVTFEPCGPAWLPLFTPLAVWPGAV